MGADPDPTAVVDVRGVESVACRGRVDPARHSVGPDERDYHQGGRAHRGNKTVR